VISVLTFVVACDSLRLFSSSSALFPPFFKAWLRALEGLSLTRMAVFLAFPELEAHQSFSGKPLFFFLLCRFGRQELRLRSRGLLQPLVPVSAQLMSVSFSPRMAIFGFRDRVSPSVGSRPSVSPLGGSRFSVSLYVSPETPSSFSWKSSLSLGIPFSLGTRTGL